MAKSDEARLGANDLSELERIQSSRKGWKYAVETLQSGAKDGESTLTFLASTILYHKVATAFQELSSEPQRAELREILFNLSRTYSQGPTLLKLSQTLATMVVQYDTWIEPLGQLESSLSTVGYVNVLCSLPDEADPASNFVKCSLKRKKLVVQMLRGHSQTVLELISASEMKASAGYDVKGVKLALTCLSNWLRNGILPTVHFLRNSTSERVLLHATGNDTDLAMLAAEIIGYAVDPACEAFVQAERASIAQSMTVVISSLLSATSRDNDIAEPASQALTDVAIFVCSELVAGAEDSDLTKATTCRNYFHSLTELLAHRRDKVVLSLIAFWSHLGEGLVAEEKGTRYFKPVMGRLVLRCRYPVEGFHTEDARESFNELREATRNLLRCYARHSLDTITLASWIRYELSSHRDDWQMFESLMHAFSALAKPMSRFGADEHSTFILSEYMNLRHRSAPAVMCTLTMCAGVFAFNAEPEHVFTSFLQVVAFSFQFREDAPSFPFRASDDHTGSVALTKLAAGYAPRIARHQAFPELANVVLAASHLLAQSKQLAYTALVKCACSFSGPECNQWVAKLLEPLVRNNEDIKVVACAITATKNVESNPGGAFVRGYNERFVQLGYASLIVYKEVLKVGNWDSETGSIDIIVAESLRALRSDTHYADAFECLRLVILTGHCHSKVVAKAFMREVTPNIVVLVTNLPSVNERSLAEFMRLMFTAGDHLPSALHQHHSDLSQLFLSVLKTPRFASGECTTLALQYLPALIKWAVGGNDEAQEVLKAQVTSYVATLFLCLRTGVLPSWRFDESVRAVFSVLQIGKDYFYDVIEQAAYLDSGNKHVKGFLTFLAAHRIQKPSALSSGSLAKAAVDKKKLRAALKRLVGGKKKGTKGHPPKAKA